MKEENTQSKKKWIYYVVLGICALLLIAATVLTVYFTTSRKTSTAEKPPVVQPDDPKDDEPGENPGDDEPGKEDPPVSGDDTVQFVKPVDCESYAVEYASIYENKSVGGWWYRHKAVDFEAAAGTEVRAMASGTVEKISLSKETGNVVIIDHGEGLKTVYRFVEPTAELKEGAAVEKGQKIGEVAEAYGSEAFAGSHLHLEIELNGDLVDPTDYLDPVLNEK